MKAAYRLVATFAFFWVLSVSTSYAQEQCTKINAVGAKIPNFVEDAENGIFVKLLRMAAQRAGLAIDISVLQKKRAVQEFLSGSVNVLFPHSSAGKEIPSYKSIPVFVKRDFAFVRKGDRIPKDIAGLKGLAVGLTHQYAYPKSITASDQIMTVKAPSDVNNIKMLSKKWLGLFEQLEMVL